MLVNTGKKTKKGKTIYALLECKKETVMCGNHPVNVPGKLKVVKEGTLNRGGHIKGKKIQAGIYGVYKKSVSQQRGLLP